MDDKTKIAPELVKTANAAVDVAVDQKPDELKHHHMITRGDRFHRWSTYLGDDVVWNAISGTAFAYLSNYTEIGKAVWKKPVTAAFEWVLGGFGGRVKPFIKDTGKELKMVEGVLKEVPGQFERSVNKGRMFSSIIAGGMLFTVPPLMVLENKKVKRHLIEFYDRVLYGKERAENDPRIKKAHEEIGNEPEKGFVTGNLSRYGALAPLLAIVLIPTTQKWSEPFFKWVEGAGDKVARKMGFTPEKVFGKLSAEKLAEASAQKRWDFVKENAALDVGLELPYAGLHYLLYGLFAGMAAHHHAKEKAKEKEKAAAAKHTAVGAVAPSAELEKPVSEVSSVTPKPSSFTARQVPAASFADRAMNADAATPELGVGR